MLQKIKPYVDLYLAFFKIGLFTFGGGYAMLPLLQREIVEAHQWASEEELMNYFAIGQSTPGIIAINTATFIGYKQKKLLGGIIATLGMVTPSWIIIIAIAAFFQQFQDNVYVAKAFAGIRIMVVVLILQAVYRMYKKNVHNKLDMAMALIAFITVALMSWSPILIILISGLVGVLLHSKKGGQA